MSCNYDYQDLAVKHAVEFLQGAKPGDRRLYAAPTGTGKSFMIARVQAEISGSIIVTPRVEIVAGFLAKRGIDVRSGSVESMMDLALSHGITTPIRLRNKLLRGEHRVPTALLIDECHHHLAESNQQIDLLCGMAPAVGWTATPYRGTMRETAEFRKQWGEPVWILTYPEAATRGVLAVPKCRTIPLVDDDVFQVVNGEYVITEVTAATKDVLGQLLDLLKPCVSGGLWDRPTVIALPGQEIARIVAQSLCAAGLPAVTVDADSTHADRRWLFAECLRCQAALVQIRVVSEGVDLPFRRLIDLSPTLSPVRWLQQVGRVTRPSTEPPEYWACNRNLLRHAYLLEGLVPPVVIKESQEAFGGLGKRAGYRVVGLEGVGRLKAAELPLADGSKGLMYCVSAVEGVRVTEYVALLHPAAAKPIWASRQNQRGSDGITKTYGRWQLCEPPVDLTGFASLPGSSPSEKQMAWWKRQARRYGLDPEVEPTKKSFAALPVLYDLNLKLKGVDL